MHKVATWKGKGAMKKRSVDKSPKGRKLAKLAKTMGAPKGYEGCHKERGRGRARCWVYL